MTVDAKPTLLIVEDDLDIMEMLTAFFRVQGYEVVTVNWGEDALRTCLASPPDLVILDIRLPDIDGFEVARQLRANRRTREIPIIFLTEKRERVDRLHGLELHAEDYITKPFDVQELRLRVRNTLQRAKRAPLTNPVTGLPEGDLTNEQLEAYLESDQIALLVISLGNLDRFREVYGIVASDDLVRAVALMIQGSLQELGTQSDFLGHITNTTFLVATRVTNTLALQERIRSRLQASFNYFYSSQDRESGTFQQEGLGVQITEIRKPAQSYRSMDELKGKLRTLAG
ncbi:MAG TPA: response regulator [Anaerolineaceae bacterium]|nr:response regulator [Anaerolineaceae bacterium]HNY99654.1 response regulator [Anaerolineaceae bacterium]HQO97216.1 response regulator [Anaerolineaceae bacterium]HQP60481.1 response regulator [Anaerolineaceae bacterium]